jgi:PPOX class probable F420-dependent enzyme
MIRTTGAPATISDAATSPG